MVPRINVDEKTCTQSIEKKQVILGKSIVLFIFNDMCSNREPKIICSINFSFLFINDIHWRNTCTSLSKKKMNEYLFLAALTITLLAGTYFVKTIILSSVQFLKGILEFFAEQ